MQEKYLWTYDTDNKIVFQTSYNYDGTTWEHYSEATYSYNLDNKLTSIVVMTFEYGNWEIWGIDSTTYYPNNTGFTNTFYTINFNGGLMEGSRHDFLQDQASNLTSINGYTSVVFGEPLELSSKTSYTYDNNYPFSELMVQSFFRKLHFNHKRLTKDYEKYNAITSQWEPQTYGTYYWTDMTMTTSTESTLAEQGKALAAVTVFPNPASDYLQFTLPESGKPATLELISTNGQRLIYQELTSSSSVDVSDLPAGFYGFLIEQDGQRHTGKDVIQ